MRVRACVFEDIVGRGSSSVHLIVICSTLATVGSHQVCVDWHTHWLFSHAHTHTSFFFFIGDNVQKAFNNKDVVDLGLNRVIVF